MNRFVKVREADHGKDEAVKVDEVIHYPMPFQNPVFNNHLECAYYVKEPAETV